MYIHTYIPCSSLADGYPPTVNNSQECFDVVVRAGSATVGADRGIPIIHTYIYTHNMHRNRRFVAATAQKSTGAEDFSFFLEERPGIQPSSESCCMSVRILCTHECMYVLLWLSRLFLLRGRGIAWRFASTPQISI